VPPCHREEIAEAVLEDNGGKDGGKPVDGGTTGGVGGKDGGKGGKPVANGLATDKSLDGNGKSLPVAGWQRFSGGAGKGDKEEPEACAVCGGPGGLMTAYGDRQAFVHPHCRQAWIAAQEGVFNQRLRLVAGSSV
jgi:hypothetical protein